MKLASNTAASESTNYIMLRHVWETPPVPGPLLHSEWKSGRKTGYLHAFTGFTVGLLGCLLLGLNVLAADTPNPASPPAVPDPVLLWPQGAPGATGSSEEDKPAIHPFLPEKALNTGCAIVVCPGGAFTHRAADYEGVLVAQFLKSRGIAAFVLRYRINPLYTRNDAVADGQRAMQYLRANAATFGISPNRIGMIGFSAGSELACLAAFRPLSGKADAEDPVERQGSKLDFMILGYGSSPAPAGQLNRTNTPPTFMFCTHEDRGHATGMINLYWEMYQANVPCEVHFFPNGEHGVGFAPGDAVLGEWPKLLYQWLRAQNFLTPAERAMVKGHVKLDGLPLPHGSITFIPMDQPGAAPVTAYIMNTDTATADFQLRREVGPVPGKYRVEVRQDATKWLSNNRDPYLSQRRNMPDARREEWFKYLRAPGWGAPTIEDVRLYRKSRPADTSDLMVEIKPGENELNVEVFSK